MVEKVGWIWLDGEMLPWDDADIHVLSHGLHYGFGVFEGIRFYKGAEGRSLIFRLEDHTTRLLESASICGLEIPYSPAEINRSTIEIIKKNGIADGYIRPVAFTGTGRMGLAAVENPVRTAIAIWEWGPYLGEEGLKNGIRCNISPIPRVFPTPELGQAKICGHYVASIMCKRHALEQGFDEGIFLDPQGNVAEGSGENIFIVRKETLFTPPLSTGILAGITRNSVMKIAADLGIEVQEEVFPKEGLYEADEVFMTGTAAEVTPIRDVDGRKVGNGGRGPITEKIQSIYLRAVRGEEENYASWLTPVE